MTDFIRDIEKECQTFTLTFYVILRCSNKKLQNLPKLEISERSVHGIRILFYFLLKQLQQLQLQLHYK